MPRWCELAAWMGCGAAIAGAYWMLCDPHWRPTSDSDFFLALARNLAQGEGFWHNGNPVGMTPPGWPLLLAGAMQVTTKLGLLKLINTAALLLFLGTGWWVLRRIVRPAATAAATVLVGMSAAAVEMNWLFLTDPSFAAAGMASFWAAVRGGESPGRGLWFWAAVSALLAVMATCMRWNGILLPALIATALFSGRGCGGRMLARRLVALAVVSVTVLASFLALRAAMTADQSRVDPRFPATMVGQYELVNSDRVSSPLDYLDRVGNAGYYLGGLLWSPLAKTKLAWSACGRLGSVLVLCCLVAAIAAARRRQLLLLGAMLYCLPIVATWPSVVPRYLLLAMPLIVAGALAGLHICLGRVCEWVPGRWVGASQAGVETEGQRQHRIVLARGFGAAIVVVLIAATLAMQAASYCGELIIVRQGARFEESAYAGVYRRLPSIAQVLEERDVQPGDVAVSEYRGNRTWADRTHGWMRALYVLTDRPVRAVPIKLSKPLEKSPETLQWLRSEAVRYYAYVPPSDMTLHFRGGRVEAYIFEGRPLLPISQRQLAETDWRLYEIDDEFEGGWRRTELPRRGFPKRVPHLKEPIP